MWCLLRLDPNAASPTPPRAYVLGGYDLIDAKNLPVLKSAGAKISDVAQGLNALRQRQEPLLEPVNIGGFWKDVRVPRMAASSPKLRICCSAAKVCFVNLLVGGNDIALSAFKCN